MMLAHAAYGKSKVRLVQVSRQGSRHELRDLTVAIRFEGDYERSYVAGDNSDVLPTDTMKNTVYALAAQHPVREPEPFGLALSRRFLDRNRLLRRVRIDLQQHPWGRMTVGDREQGHAFLRTGSETRTATIQGERDRPVVGAGVKHLVILKTSGSAFAGFPRDEYTTLPETGDRILATSMTATWRYRDHDIDFGVTWQAIRRTLLEVFAEHDSKSVQHTLHAMGQAVLDSAADVTAIRLVMPNRHHLPVDLSALGLENRNEVFVATDQPYGLIEATLTR